MDTLKIFVRENGACKEAHLYQPEPFRVIRIFVGSHDVDKVKARAQQWAKEKGYEIE